MVSMVDYNIDYVLKIGHNLVYNTFKGKILNDIDTQAI